MIGLSFFIVFVISSSSYFKEVLADTTPDLGVLEPSSLQDFVRVPLSLSIGPTIYDGSRRFFGISPPPPPPPAECRNNEVISYCYNNNCLKRYCFEDDIAPDCQLGDICRPGCSCKQGYLRAQNETCVPENLCPIPIICRDDEMYSTCINNDCFKTNCSQLMDPTKCKDNIFQGECVEGCMCRYQFFRADDGTCVPPSLCPSIIKERNNKKETKENIIEELSKDDKLSKRERRSLSDNNIISDISVTESQESLCGEDKIFSSCYNNYCVRRYCDEEAPSPDCKLQDELCQSGCVCKEGYLRAKNDTCVREELCNNPIKCREDEVFSNCINGGCSKRTCKEVDFPPICIDISAQSCESGCVCKDDYLRTANGTCVLIKDCPESEVCSGSHKYYDPCLPSCSARVCLFSDSPIECPPDPQPEDRNCYPGCVCEEGFYKNLQLECVPFEHCPKYCFGNNESPVSYVETCEEQTCDDFNNTEILRHSNNKTCNICRCIPGYVRNKHGECIAKENCGKCQGPNEYFGCSSPCDNVCATLDKWNRTNCTIQPDWEYCVDMCYCDDGYARDTNNICIPIAECPKPTSGEK